jgi:hypothetical protein
VESKKNKKPNSQRRGWLSGIGVGDLWDVGERVQVLSHGWISSEDLVFSLGLSLTTLVFPRNLLRGQILSFLFKTVKK